MFFKSILKQKPGVNTEVFRAVIVPPVHTGHA